MTPFQNNEADDVPSREQYVAEVRNWAMNMLEILRPHPGTGEKLSLLRQVDKVKGADGVNAEELPAYCAVLAYLSRKAALLAQGKQISGSVSRDEASACLKSEVLKKKFSDDDNNFHLFREYLQIKRTDAGSETLRRLSESGH